MRQEGGLIRLALLLLPLLAATPAEAQPDSLDRLIGRCLGEDPGASPADAATACTRLLDIPGGDPRRRAALLVARATALERQGERGEAVVDLDAAIGLWPDHVPGLFLRALILRDLGRAAAAEADLTTAIEAAPDEPALHNNRGGLRRARGDLAAAREDYARAVALDPDYAKARANLALTRHRLGEADDAARDLAAAIAAAGPEEGWPHAVRGAIALERGDLASAEADLEESLEREPDDAETLWLRGLLRARQGDAAGAAEDAARARRLLPMVEPVMLGIFGPGLMAR